MTSFVLATNNPGKLREMRALLEDGSRVILSQEQAGISTAPEETGSSFEENARIKARAACEASGLPAIADDSGLEVDALGGAPGIHSARYAAPGQRKSKLLRSLQDVPDALRTARFVSAVACVFPDGRELVVRGECEGFITRECRGSGGFGYDPLFYVPACGKTFAEMSDEEKNSVSHRARGMQSFASELQKRGW